MKSIKEIQAKPVLTYVVEYYSNNELSYADVINEVDKHQLNDFWRNEVSRLMESSYGCVELDNYVVVVKGISGNDYLVHKVVERVLIENQFEYERV